MKRLLLPILAALALPTAVNAEFVPGYASKAEGGRAKLNFERINKYIDRYNSEDATVRDKCGALWDIAFKANFNEEPLDYWYPRSDGSCYDYAKRIRTKFNNAGCPYITNRSTPF